MSTKAECIALLRTNGRAKAMKGSLDWIWISALTDLTKRARKRATKTMVNRAVRELADDVSLRSSFESAVRLGDGRAVLMWLNGRYWPPPLTEKQREDRRIAGLAKRAKADEAHARAMLAHYEKAAKRARNGIKRWKRTVSYYDRKRSAA